MTVRNEVSSPSPQPLGDNPPSAVPPSFAGLVKAASEIAERRRNILLRLKHYLKIGEKEKALELAGELCGMEEYEQESHRATESVH